MSIIIKIGITTGVIILVERAGFEYHPLNGGARTQNKNVPHERGTSEAERAGISAKTGLT
jgi:hypothetical protein